MADEPLNPYAPPKNLEALLPSASPAGQLNSRHLYRPYELARGKATLAVWASVISLILQTTMLVSCILQLSLLQGGKNGAGIDPAAASANDSRQTTILAVVVISALATLITLLVWIHATHANLHALGAREIEFTPGWAVGWFFVPLMNLFKPYQVVKEIWQGSDPGELAGGIPSGTALIGWWWGLRILSGVMGRLSTTFAKNGDTLDELIGVTWLAIVLIVAIDMPLLILQILLILKTQSFQEQRYALILAQPPATPPSDDANPLATFR